MKDKLKVYLGDLTHDTVVLVSDTIPINIGFVATYLKKSLGDDVEITLFKYPNEMVQALRENPADVVALSNYSWNSHLSERMSAFAHEQNPASITVQGGTNLPHRSELQKEFLLTRPATDFFIELEGEVALTNLVSKILDFRKTFDGMGNRLFRDALFSKAIDGCLFIQPETRSSEQPVFIKGEKPARLTCLDEIPSPYLTGILDKFFDGKLTPFIETNRGCPFTCSFCHTGSSYFNKINHFSAERVREELAYIAPRVSKLGIRNLHVADTNFGMYARDKEICEMLLESQKRYLWPTHIMATTGKNKKEQVIDITQMMGTSFSVNMSVQSMDAEVLRNINRSNIKLEHYTEITRVLNERGRATKGEVIIGLPGESKQTFVDGLRKILEAGVSQVSMYSLMLLHGTSFQEPEYRAKYKIVGKYRIVPLNFGEYAGKKVFDTEEVGVETRDMPFDDYLWIRGLCLLVETLHNSRPYHEFFKYADSIGISTFDFILMVYNRLAEAPPAIKELMKEFIAETRTELWDSEEELISFYRNEANYQKLLAGELGGNLIFKYKSLSLVKCKGDWIKFLSSLCLEWGLASAPNKAVVDKEVAAISQFVDKRLDGLLQPEANTSNIEMVTHYDLLAWRASSGKSLSTFYRDEPFSFEFKYSEEQLEARTDQFKRYGTSVSALSKIVTRVSNVESLFRKVAYGAGTDLSKPDSTDSKIEQDLFVRYSTSG